MTEGRYFWRARNAGRERELFPEIDGALLLARLAATLRRMHDADLWHRDVSAGNVLLAGDWSGRVASAGELYLIDLARTRIGKPLTRSERMRDLARLPLHRAEDRAALLAPTSDGRRRSSSEACSRCTTTPFICATAPRTGCAACDARRGASARAARTRTSHRRPTTPRCASEWCGTRSDQPHLHAGRAAKLRTRLADAGIHGREAALLLRRLPSIAARYRTLRRALYSTPSAFGEAGVGLHGGSAPPDLLIAEVEALGMSRILLRIQPWEGELERDGALARELRARGVDVMLAVAQNRDLVRDPALWRASLAEIAERFDGVVSQVQIGHAINRSKWGIWNQREYAALVSAAAEVFAARSCDAEPAMRIVGPGVIDFELYATCIALDWPENPVRFDAVTSLLYVDRRGAPENRHPRYASPSAVTSSKSSATWAR